MGSWLAKAMTFWPIAAFLTPVLLAVGLLWLRTKFADIATFNKAVSDLGALNTRVQIIEVQLRELRSDVESEPTRAQVLAQLADAISRLSRLEGGIEGVNRQLASQSQWLQGLAMPPGGAR